MTTDRLLAGSGWTDPLAGEQRAARVVTGPGAVRAHRRAWAGAAVLTVAAGACAAAAASPDAIAAGTVVVVRNPIYTAAAPALVAPRALAAGPRIVVPEGATVTVDPAGGAVLRVTATATEARTARDLADTVLVSGLPAALRVQVADGLRALRSATTGTAAKADAAEIDGVLEATGLRVVPVSRATGTTPLGAGLVQAVAVGRIVGLPAEALDPTAAAQVVAGTLQVGSAAESGSAADQDSVVVQLSGRTTAALTLTVTAGSPDAATAAVRVAVTRAQGRLDALLHSSGSPAESLVLAPLVGPAPTGSTRSVPWWLLLLLGGAGLATAAGAVLDRRERVRGRLRLHPGRRPQAGRSAASRRGSARDIPVGQSVPASPIDSPIHSVVDLVAASAPAAGASPDGRNARGWDWQPVSLARWQPGDEAQFADGTQRSWGLPAGMPPGAPADPPGMPVSTADGSRVLDLDAPTDAAPASTDATDPVIDLRARLFGVPETSTTFAMAVEPVQPLAPAIVVRPAVDPAGTDPTSTAGLPWGPAPVRSQPGAAVPAAEPPPAPAADALDWHEILLGGSGRSAAPVAHRGGGRR
jgi:hypothetical protein